MRAPSLEPFCEGSPGRRPISLCHVVFRLDVGGLENGLVNLINHLPAGIYRHTVVSLMPATAFRERIRRDDVRVIEIGKREGKDLAAYGKVWRAVRALKPDIVHTRNIATLDQLPVAWAAGAARLVHSEHGLDMAELTGRHARYNRLRRLSRLLVDRYVAVSRDLSDWLRAEIAVRPDRLALIYNGVDTGRFSPSVLPAALPEGFAGRDPFVIGTIGRMEPVKDQALLVRAFRLALEIRPELRDRLRLVLVGDGRCRRDLEALAAEAGIAPLVWFAGLRSDAPALYRAFDVFVLPSKREGISNTLLEAMASGLPVIATDVGGNPEVVEAGVTGQIVPPGDPEALCEALLAYLDRPALRARHGFAGRVRAEARFSLDAMIAGYRTVYEAL